MRRAYYRKKVEREVAEHKEPVMPYLIRERAVEAAIARMLFGNATTMERHKRYVKRRIIACYADLSDSKRIIEIKDKNTGRTLVPEDIQFRGFLMQVLYYLDISGKEVAILVINYSSKDRSSVDYAKELLWQSRCCGARMRF
jgi:hypothetical protein